MEQTKALNALEPFLALTKSASSPGAAADLITRATSHPSTFVFAELLNTPNIRSLSQSPGHASYLQLLQIFSYGTYTDYHATPNLPSLNAAQTLKLRQLSFLTLARTPENLSYRSLLEALALETPAELEQLVISTIYAGLVTGTLDPYHQTVNLSSVAPLRDLPPNSIPSMINTLQAWSSRCTTTLASLESQIASIKAASIKRQKADAEWAATVEKLVEGKGQEGKKETGRGAQEGGSAGQSYGGIASKRESDRISDQDDGDMDIDSTSPDDEGERASKAARKKGGNSIFTK